jgi:hypothetical protein
VVTPCPHCNRVEGRTPIESQVVTWLRVVQDEAFEEDDEEGWKEDSIQGRGIRRPLGNAKSKQSQLSRVQASLTPRTRHSRIGRCSQWGLIQVCLTPKRPRSP